MSMVCYGLLFVMKCVPVGGVADAATFCRNYEPVQWSRNDTQETIRQNDRNNRVWRALCNQGSPWAGR